MKNTELIHVYSGDISSNATVVKATKRLPRPFVVKGIWFTFAGTITYPIYMRFFIGSPDTTDPVNDPSCREITSKLGSSEGITTLTVHPVVWPEMDIKVDQQDRAIIVSFENKNPGTCKALVNFHLQMM